MPIEDILIDLWILEDAPYGDITAGLLPDMNVKARIISKDEGIIAGMFLVRKICRKMGISLHTIKDDGDYIGHGDIIAELYGNSRRILLCERLILNLLMYLSGIATTTRIFVEKARRVNPRVRIAATRKTIPGLRWASKVAVKIGGGDTHRFGLSDSYLIKDNHIRIAGDLERIIIYAKKDSSFTKLVEVEVRTVEEAIIAARSGADIIMFDNMSPSEINQAIEKIKDLGLREKLILEVSGGITLDNIEEYARLDIDVISTSIITMRPKPLDLALKIVSIEEKEG